QGGLWVAITQMLIPNEKVNDGAYLATKFNTPLGTWSNPGNIYASNTFSWMFLIPCFTGVFLAVSQAVSARGYVEEVVAGYPFAGNVAQGGGPNHYGQEGSWCNFDMSSCGTSAGYVRDGEASAAAMWNPEGDMGDVEAWELLEPPLYLGRRLRPSSPGMGKYRGGAGFDSLRMIYNTSHCPTCTRNMTSTSARSAAVTARATCWSATRRWWCRTSTTTCCWNVLRAPLTA
ncbi:MAG: hydantoinase B/oxoprolinase family protein, partial [Proteobacteria bacterium]|nr:hydantoinase B/oxoprolinase family protein [Pseudomonadota bacterium]